MAEKKVKNNAVEFWRIVLTIGVTFFHFNVFTNVMMLGRVPGETCPAIFAGG